MTERFDKQRLREALAALSDRARAAFAAACAARLGENYVAFHRLYRWGDPRVLDDALELVWGHARSRGAPRAALAAAAEACERVVPDTEDFPSLYGSLALRAGSAVLCALRSCDEEVDDRAGWAAGAARCGASSVYEYLGVAADPQLGPHASDGVLRRWVLEAPLYWAELHKQWEDVAALRARPVPDDAYLLELRQSCGRMGIRPITRGLLPTLGD